MEFEYLGPYKIDGILGKGGMGAVYRGVHAKSGQKVALKVIANELANNERFRRRFDAEITILRRLRHPNIVDVYGCGEERGQLFYFMEYVEGRNLQDLLRSQRRLTWQQTISIGIQTCAALKHAHVLGIIHRDLKPANLMVTADGRTKLTDFGISKAWSMDMTAEGAVIGTADYMPPEQAEGKEVTPRSDLYSLGALLYALLAGRPPFMGKNLPEVLYSVRYSPVPPLLNFAPETPVELVELIDQLLEKDAGRRPPTALAVMNRLSAMEKGLEKRRLQSNIAEAHDESANPTPTELGEQLTSLDLNDLPEDSLPRMTGDDVALSIHDRPTEVATPSKLADLGLDDLVSPPTANAADQSNTNRESQDEKIVNKSPKQGTGSPVASTEPPVSHSSSIRRAPSIHAPAPKDAKLAGAGNLTAKDIDSGSENQASVDQENWYRTFDEQERKRAALSSDEADNNNGTDWAHVASITVLSLLLVGCLIAGWFLLKPASADQLYDQISLAAATGDDSVLIGVSGSVETFLESYPDDLRHNEIQALANEIDIIRMFRLLSRKVRAGGEQDMSPLEQAFLDAMQARSVSVNEADQKFDALLTVFSRRKDLDPSDQKVLRVAQFAAERLRNMPIAKTGRAAEELRDWIGWGDKNLSGQEKIEFYEGIVTLYSDKLWAKDLVERSQAALIGLRAAEESLKPE